MRPARLCRLCSTKRIIMLVVSLARCKRSLRQQTLPLVWAKLRYLAKRACELASRTSEKHVPRLLTGLRGILRRNRAMFHTRDFRPLGDPYTADAAWRPAASEDSVAALQQLDNLRKLPLDELRQIVPVC